MRLIAAILVISGVLLHYAYAQNQTTASDVAPQTIDNEASWIAPEGELGKIREKCAILQGSAVDECFTTGMREAGASAWAVAFVKRTGKLAYMSKFLETGRVDVAYGVHPFRANENYSWFLINGVPDLIDVDDPMYRNKTGYEKDTRYTSLMKKYPKLSFWPEDRTSKSVPMIKKLRGQGQRFVINYRITDGCRACEYLGTAWFAFDFDRNGKFLGTKFLGIENAQRKSTSLNQPELVEQGFTNPKRPVEAKAGQQFTIVLGANHTTGYRWQLANGTDKNIVGLLGSEYKASDEGRVGSGGREVWTFLAKSQGRTKISFRYARPWEKEAGAKTTSFEIVVQ